MRFFHFICIFPRSLLPRFGSLHNANAVILPLPRSLHLFIILHASHAGKEGIVLVVFVYVCVCVFVCHLYMQKWKIY